jgi:hypothetical protein
MTGRGDRGFAAATISREPADTPQTSAKPRAAMHRAR